MINKKNKKSKQSPLVSIITPSYNQGKYIEDNILSVKNQDYPNIEHIIIDGCSRDNTLNILKKYDGTYNMSWISEPDGGMYEAINKGLKMARGEILAYLNADDIYFPWTVKMGVECLSDNPDVDLVYGDMLTFDMNSRRINCRFGAQDTIAQPTTFWRKRVYKNLGGFDEALEVSSDAEYLLRIIKKYKIKKIDEFLTIFRLHQDQKSFTESGTMTEDLKQIGKKFYIYAYGSRVYWLISRIRYFCFSRRYMVKILYMYLLNRIHVTPSCWRNFLSLKNVKIAPFHRCLLSFLPLPYRCGYFQILQAPDLLEILRLREITPISSTKDFEGNLYKENSGKGKV